MSLLDALLLDPARINVWIAYRTDGVKGSGTQNDPWDGSTAAKFDAVMSSLSANTTECPVVAVSVRERREMLGHIPVWDWMFEQEQTEGTETDDSPVFPDLASNLRFLPLNSRPLAQAVNNFPKMVVASSGGGGAIFSSSKVKWGPNWTVGMKHAILRHHAGRGFEGRLISCP